MHICRKTVWSFRSDDRETSSSHVVVHRFFQETTLPSWSVHRAKSVYSAISRIPRQAEKRHLYYKKSRCYISFLLVCSLLSAEHTRRITKVLKVRARDKPS